MGWRHLCGTCCARKFRVSLPGTTRRTPPMLIIRPVLIQRSQSRWTASAGITCSMRAAGILRGPAWKRLFGLTNGSVFDCKGLRCTPVHQVTDFSLECAWPRIAEHVLKYELDSEGTVMAMAALGDPAHYCWDFEQRWAWLPCPDGSLDRSLIPVFKAFSPACATVCTPSRIVSISRPRYRKPQKGVFANF